MARFKMIHVNVGDDVQVSFVCEHCAPGDISGLGASAVYGRAFAERLRRGGECPRCSGTGFDPAPLAGAKICRSCGGTALCPHCAGSFVRSWAELPFESQERFLQHWESAGTYPENYASFGKLHPPVPAKRSEV